jgi:hypothetical protein
MNKLKTAVVRFGHSAGGWLVHNEWKIGLVFYIGLGCIHTWGGTKADSLLT